MERAVPSSTRDSRAPQVSEIGTFASETPDLSASVHHACGKFSERYRIAVRDTNRVPKLARWYIRLSNREMNQVKVNITKTPSIILCMPHLYGMLSDHVSINLVNVEAVTLPAMIVVPQLCRHKNLGSSH